jgi:predicted NBD/HSP70 family sugar kinase
VEISGKIWGIGIGVAGLVNSKTDIIELSPDFGWSDINLREELRKKIDLPFFYENSTRLMAMGELYFGENLNIKNFAVINVGYGIAAGLVVEGTIVKGHLGFAGEFGHIPVNSQSQIKCKCGMKGCLEVMASGNRIATLGKKELLVNNSTIIKELCENNEDLVTSELIAKAAKKGDPGSIKIFSEVTENLCKGIGILANLLNPEVVYIGGGVSLSGDFFFDMIENQKSKFLLAPNKNLMIKPATFGDQATSIGAVAMILEKIINLDFQTNEKVS